MENHAESLKDTMLYKLGFLMTDVTLYEQNIDINLEKEK